MSGRIIKKVKNTLSQSPIGEIKRAFFPHKANITQPFIPATRKFENEKTLIMVVMGKFNQEALNASTLIPLGFAHGWANSCGPVVIIQDIFLMKELPKYNNPAICLSTYHLTNLTLSECKILRKYDTFISVSIHPSTIKDFKKKFFLEKNEADTKIWEDSYKKTLEIQPKFVCNSVGKTGMGWYQGWVDDGLKWVTLHPAADPKYYYPESPSVEFSKIKIGYVGGYWTEKAQSFDLYLRPFEDVFTPFGYATWPYKNYGGKIDLSQERILYSSAGLIPLITSPGGWLLSEITERYFKAPACKAFCIADENPALREIFSPDEMLQANDAEHFQFLVQEYLKGNIDVNKWKESGYKAVMEKHLYTHRAMLIKNSLS
jgi:hypothetical protein